MLGKQFDPNLVSLFLDVLKEMEEVFLVKDHLRVSCCFLLKWFRRFTMNQLIRCKNCDEIFMKTPFDQCPEYEWDPSRSPENFRSIEKDDFQDFLIHHHGHQLENLKIIEDSFVSEKAYFEPIKTSFFKATNGKEKFVIKKFREKIDEPLKYQLISGDYSLKCTAIEIQSEEISKQLKRELKPPLSQTQMDAFLKLYRAYC